MHSHNLPRLLRGPQPNYPLPNWSLSGFRELFLDPLLDRYPDLRARLAVVRVS
jgi:hypothetical protein